MTISRYPDATTEGTPRLRAARKISPPDAPTEGNTGPFAHRGPNGLGTSGLRIQDQRRTGRLIEVELQGQVAQDRHPFPNGPTRVRPAVRRRVQARTAQEAILDQLEVRVERQRLVVDV